MSEEFKVEVRQSVSFIRITSPFKTILEIDVSVNNDYSLRKSPFDVDDDAIRELIECGTDNELEDFFELIRKARLAISAKEEY